MAELYTKPADDWLSEEEIRQEELKKVVQADALKAYGLMRQQVVKFKKLKDLLAKLKSGFSQKRKSIQGVAFLIGSLAVLTAITMGVVNKIRTDDNGVLSDINQTPDFTSLSPPDTSGAQGFRFNAEVGSATYQDELGGAGSITISQQPIPQEMSQMEGGVSKLALSLENKNIIDEVQTNKGPIYVARVEAGKQTVILGHNELFIFITANHEVDNQSWADYVNNLQ